jgi:type II secretory pathway pseudopilin PulG
MSKEKQKKISQQGFTLIGLMISVTIMGIVFGSSLALVNRNIRLASVTTHEITASALAEEGVELIRNIRDTGDNYYFLVGGEDCISGFTKIEKDGSYSFDYTEDTYNATDILDTQGFADGNAGLCKDDDGLYSSCSLDNSSLAFIRKINLEKESPDCQNKGVLVTVTVYWAEFWEQASLPSNVADLDDLNLYNTQVKKCMYDWRPR